MPSKHTALIAVLAASVAGQVAAAGAGSILMTYFAVGAFTLAALQYAFSINRAWWSAGSQGLGPSPEAARPIMAANTADLLGLGYGWGGASLLCVYLLSGLRWQHGWEYGLGMVVIAALVLAWARSQRGAPCSPAQFRRLMALSAVHGIAALGGVGWLLASGKAQSIKGDWAANAVFLLGGLLIAGVTAMGLKTARRLEAEEARL